MLASINFWLAKLGILKYKSKYKGDINERKTNKKCFFEQC